MTLQSNVNFARKQRSCRVACQAFPAFTDMIGATGAKAMYERLVNKEMRIKSFQLHAFYILSVG